MAKDLMRIAEEVGGKRNKKMMLNFTDREWAEIEEISAHFNAKPAVLCRRLLMESIRGLAKQMEGGK